MDDKKLFEIICSHKDSNPSNLNKLFDSYGCDTLESKVPVVQDEVIKGLTSIKSDEQRLYSSLTLKAHSAQQATRGQPPRTRNRTLKVVKVGDETLIAAGKPREEEPVDEEELDKELDEYMKETARLRQQKKALEAIHNRAAMEVEYDIESM